MTRYSNNLSISKLLISFITIILFSATVLAVPMPWLVSNLDPGGETTFIRDTNGRVIQSAVLVQLILDSGDDGPNPPSAQFGSYGQPTGNDELVTSRVCYPAPGINPNGGFALLYTIDTDDPVVSENANAFIRVFGSAIPGNETPFLDSEIFNGPHYPAEAQTVVVLPNRMTGYIGNDRPELEANYDEITVRAGEEAILVLTADDDSDELSFSVLTDQLPGGEESVILTQLMETVATVSWIPPFDATGNHDLICSVTDGQYTASVTVEVEVTAGSDLPSAFHLLSPLNNAALWETSGFEWQESIDSEDQFVRYTLYWATDANFSDIDSIANIVDTYVDFDIDTTLGTFGKSGEITPGMKKISGTERIGEKPGFGIESTKSNNLSSKKSKSGELNQKSLQESSKQPDNLILFEDRQKKSPNTLASNSEQRLRSKKSSLPAAKGITNTTRKEDAFNIRKSNRKDFNESSLDVVEGETIYWYVRAYDLDDNARVSAETWSAVAEIPEPPEIFHLSSPNNRSRIRTQSPTLSWTEAYDPDTRDTVMYDLIWSLDNWETVDTIRSIPDTLFGLSDPNYQNLPGAGRFQDALKSLAIQSGEDDLDDLPDESTVVWTVEAVDVTGLRTGARERWSFRISIEDAPGYFNLASPANRTLFSRIQPVLLTWTSSEDPDPNVDPMRYDVLATGNPTLTDPLDFTIAATGIDEPFFLLQVADNDDQLWRWTVRAISDDDTTWATTGEQGYSEFAISAPDTPEPFSLISPEDEGTSSSAMPALTWATPADPDYYDPIIYTIYFSTDEWESTDSISWIADTAYTFGTETDGALNLNGSEENSEKSKKIRHNEGKLNKISSDVEETLSNINSKPISQSSLKKSAGKTALKIDELELDEFEDGTTVHWRVYAQDTNSPGTWCEPESGWSFQVQINYPPTAFNLVSPENEEIVPDSIVTFRWEESEDPEETVLTYRLMIADNPYFDDPQIIETEETSENVLLEDFESGMLWWKVAAEDEGGEVTESDDIWTIDFTWSFVEREPEQLPTEFGFNAVYPNPFNPSVTMILAIPNDQPLSIKVIDILGRELMHIGPERFQPGYRKINIDLKGRPSGTYFLQLENSSEIFAQRRIVLVK
ncbi:MAG: T9SS type A sorting domain-containing protein [Candidatus Electryonea clarkiae]|nr:T9SS type A sorting domain-containing protein [Candidatus Electryonea clarkiae]MDP8285677.1 T9SS type A sorting domain-containing protein [Candidatus Electryonea clarkiae]